MFFGSEAPEDERETNLKEIKPSAVPDGITLHKRMCPWIGFERRGSVPVALAYTTLACGSLFCRSSTALPIFVDVAFLALWHSSKIICGRGQGANCAAKDDQRDKRAWIPASEQCFVSSPFNSDKGYDSVKVRLAPVEDLFDSGPVLSSSLALPDQRRVGSKQDSF